MWFAAGAIELNRLLLLQKRAFRIICGAPQLSHSMPLALQLNILPLHEYITFSVRLFTFNIYHNILQISVHILFTNLSHLYNYSRLRHSLYNFVAIRCNTSKCQSFILYRDKQSCNNLPTKLKECFNFLSFKCILKPYLSQLLL